MLASYNSIACQQISSKKSHFGQQNKKCCSAPLTGYRRCKLQIRYYMLISNEIMTKLLDKIHIFKQSEIKVFTTVARMYRNTVSRFRSDILNLPSDMSFFASQNNFLAETTQDILYFSNLDLEMR